MHDLATCHNSKRTRKFLDCNEIPVLSWLVNSPEMKSVENVCIIMKKDIGNQLLCLKEEMWKRVLKRGTV